MRGAALAVSATGVGGCAGRVAWEGRGRDDVEAVVVGRRAEDVEGAGAGCGAADATRTSGNTGAVQTEGRTSNGNGKRRYGQRWEKRRHRQEKAQENRKDTQKDTEGWKGYTHKYTHANRDRNIIQGGVTSEQEQVRVSMKGDTIDGPPGGGGASMPSSLCMVRRARRRSGRLASSVRTPLPPLSTACVSITTTHDSM